MSRILLATFGFAVVCICGVSCAFALPPEINQGWERLKETCDAQSHLMVTSEIRGVIRGGSEPGEGHLVVRELYTREEGETSAKFLQLLSHDGAAIDKRTQAVVDNGKYRFIIARSMDREDWTLQDVTPTAEASQSDQVPPGWDVHAYRPVALNGVLLSDLASLPEVSLSEPAPVGDLTQLIFQFDGQTGPFGADVGKLIVWLDPRHDYRIVRAVAEPKPGAIRPMRLAWECSYDPITGLVASAKDSGLRERPDLAPPLSVEDRKEHEYDWTYRGPEDDSELYLSFYGLPEPSYRVPGSYRTPMWLYYFVGGVLCVGVGAFAVHRALKGKASA